MMDQVKKDKECLVIQYFMEKYADFPKGKLVKSESPDFIVKLGRKRRIGIELTQLDVGRKIENENWPKQLQDLHDKKEDKLTLYKKQLLKEYWLLIAIETIDLIDIDLSKMKLDSKFNKVFLFDVFSGCIYNL